jgi:dCMP deaminase
VTRSSWNTVWAEVAQAVAKRSACNRSQVGAVLVKDNRVVSTGYNGPAKGYPADTSLGCAGWCQRALETPDLAAGYGFGCPSIHAEANALLYASRTETEGATMYVTHAPCADCAKLISNSGVARVILLQQPEEHRPDPVPYLRSCGIFVGMV